MSGRIRKCKTDNIYTFRTTCPVCRRETCTAHPARFSPHDSLWKYCRG